MDALYRWGILANGVDLYIGTHESAQWVRVKSLQLDEPEHFTSQSTAGVDSLMFLFLFYFRGEVWLAGARQACGEEYTTCSNLSRQLATTTTTYAL